MLPCTAKAENCPQGVAWAKRSATTTNNGEAKFSGVQQGQSKTGCGSGKAGQSRVCKSWGIDVLSSVMARQGRDLFGNGKEGKTRSRKATALLSST